MDWRRQCAVVIPCLQEAGTIAGVVRQAAHHVPVVIVVDDGSADETTRVAAEAGATVLRHRSNQGKGCSLREGFQRARDLGCSWALTMDGDGQHAADDIPKFFETARRTGAALVVGDRMGAPGRMPWLRRQVNRWMSRRLGKLAGASWPDSQCGFRLVNLDVAARARLTANHFEAESELLLRFAALGAKIEFVPIQVIYLSGASKINPVLDTWRWLRWWMTQKRLGGGGARSAARR